MTVFSPGKRFVDIAAASILTCALSTVGDD